MGTSNIENENTVLPENGSIVIVQDSQKMLVFPVIDTGYNHTVGIVLAATKGDAVQKLRSQEGGVDKRKRRGDCYSQYYIGDALDYSEGFIDIAEAEYVFMRGTSFRNLSELADV